MNSATVAYVGSFVQRYISIFLGLFALNAIVANGYYLDYIVISLVVLTAGAVVVGRRNISLNRPVIEFAPKNKRKSYLGDLGEYILLSPTARHDFTASATSSLDPYFSNITIDVPSKTFKRLIEGPEWRGNLDATLRFQIAHEIGHVIFKDMSRVSFLVGCLVMAGVLAAMAILQILLSSGKIFTVQLAIICGLGLCCAGSSLMILREAEYYADRFAAMICGEKQVIALVRQYAGLSRRFEFNFVTWATHPNWRQRLNRLTTDKNYLPAVSWVASLLLILLLLYISAGGGTVVRAAVAPLSLSLILGWLIGPLGALPGVLFGLALALSVLWWWAFGLIGAWSHFSYEAASSKNGVWVVALVTAGLLGYFAVSGWTVMATVENLLSNESLTALNRVSDLTHNIWGAILAGTAIVCSVSWAFFGSRIFGTGVSMPTRRRAAAYAALWMALFPLFLLVGLLSVPVGAAISVLCLMALIWVSSKHSERPETGPWSHLRGVDRLFGADWALAQFIERLGIAITFAGPCASLLTAMLQVHFDIFNDLLPAFLAGVVSQLTVAIFLYRIVGKSQRDSRRVSGLVTLI
jgi:hypothetical protein